MAHYFYQICFKNTFRDPDRAWVLRAARRNLEPSSIYFSKTFTNVSANAKYSDECDIRGCI
jgi:hypothetical protein